MGSNLEMIDQESESGVVVGNSKMSSQCSAAMNKANLMIGIIRKGSEKKMDNTITFLYCTNQREDHTWNTVCSSDHLLSNKMQKS